jgi:hypothetical protein
VANVSDSARQIPGDTLRLPEYHPGEDETWDKLGKEWQAVEGAINGTRLYVTWATDEDGRSELTGLCIQASAVTGELLRMIPVARLSRLPAAVRLNVAEIAPLRRRKDDAPEEFADRVAWYYRVFGQMTSHPAKAIAEHSHVPVGTVRGWIREARMRGKLPPGTRGRAG